MNNVIISIPQFSQCHSCSEQKLTFDKSSDFLLDKKETSVLKKKMSLKLREFARTDEKSERIYGSDAEDDIRYLPPDLPQPTSGKDNIAVLYLHTLVKNMLNVELIKLID